MMKWIGAALALLFCAPAFADQAPETPLVTGPNMQQTPASQILIKVPGSTIQTLGAALAASGCTTNCTLSNPTISGGSFSGTSASGGNIAVKPVVGSYQSPVLTGVPMLWSRVMANGTSVAATDTGGTSLIGFTAPYAMHDLRAIFSLYQDSQGGGGESALSNPVTWSATLEYPIGTFRPMTFNGAMSVTGRGGFVTSDQIGIDIPAGNSPFVRTYTQVCLPPTAAAASAGTGGSLSAATYYVKITQLCGAQGESGPSPEASVAVSASGTLILTWTPPLAWAPPQAPNTTAAASVPPTAFNVYLATSTGAEKYLTTIYNPGAATYTYAGGITVGAASPPSNQTFPWGPDANTGRFSNEGANYVSHGGGNATNQTLTSGTAWEVSSNSTFVFAPIALVGTPDQGRDVPICTVYGDSIAYGVNDTLPDRGIIARQLIANNIAYWFAPVPGETNANLFVSTGVGAMRMQFSGSSSCAITEYGTNDINGGLSLASIQANQITNWSDMARRGAKVYQTTILPRVGTTDSQATTANQYPGGVTEIAVTGATNATPIVITGNNSFVSGNPVYVNGVGGNANANGQNYACNPTGTTFQLYADAGCTTPIAGNGAYTSGGFFSQGWLEAVRVAENTWLRCGAPVTSASNLTAIACGTSGALLAGQTGHPLAAAIDINTGVEVNLANALTLNGGRWLSNGTASYCTTDGTHPSPAVCGAAISALIPTGSFAAP